MRQSSLSEQDEGNEMSCVLCGRESSGDLCLFHQIAKESVEKAYRAWKEAYGDMGWEDYLDKIKHNIQTGQWAKEIAEFLGAS